MRHESGQGWKVYLGDSREILPHLPRNVSLLVTDPPYGVQYKSGWNSHKGISGDTESERDSVYEVIRLAVRTLGASSQHLYVFGDWELTRVTGVNGSVELVWDKIAPAMGDLSSPWSRNYEHIQFGSTNSNGAKGLMRKRRGATLSYQAIRGRNANRHPTEKPVPLLRELIESSSRAGDVVLDPYMGSGSTGVAAILEGRHFTGIELYEPYFDSAVERLRSAEALWKAQEVA